MDLTNRYKITKNLMLILLSLCPIFKSQAQRIFWSERTNNRIMVASDILSISDPTPYVTTGVDNVQHLEIDQSSGYIVVTLNGGEGIYRLDIDGTNLKEVRDFGAFTGFNDLEVNPDDGLIYGSEFNGGVYYYDVFDNNVPSAENQMTMTGTGPGVPNDDYSGLAYYSANNNVFLSRPGGNDVFVTSDPQGDVVAGGNPGISPDLMEIDENNNQMYYVEGDQLSRSNLSFGSAELLVDAGTQIFDIEIYPNLGIYYCTNTGIFLFDFELESNTQIYTGTGIRGLGVERDFSRPVVQNYVPNQGQSGVAIGATQFMLRFDEDIKTSITGASGTDTEIQVFRNGSLFESIPRSSANLSISGRDLTINLTNGLTPGDYHVLIGGNTISNVSNLDYSGISNNTTWSFTVQCDDPTTQASGLTITRIGNGDVDFSWINGDGDHTIVLAKNGSVVDATPDDLNTYSANAEFGIGDEIGTGNFVVFNGTLSNGATFGLQDGITHLAAFSYNATNQCYLTTSPARAQSPDFIADLINASGPGDISPLTTDEIVFSFEIVSGSSEMLITDIDFVSGGLNEISDWTQLVEDIWLEDDAGNRHNLTDGGALNASSLNFTNLNTGGIGNVAGGSSKVYDLHAQFFTALGGVLPETIDNMQIEFDTSVDRIFFDPSSATAFMQSVFKTASSGLNNIRVVASEIAIDQQPSISVDQLEVLPQQPIFEATDANGNRDLDFTDTFVVGTADPDDLVPASPLTSFSLGVADFAGSGFNFEDAGTSTMHITASPSAIISPNSSSITVNAIPPVLTIADVTVMNNTTCATPNGSIQVISITPGVIADYTFLLEDDMATPISGTGPTYSGLTGGDYVLFATNNNSSLISSGLNITIAEILPVTVPPTGIDNNVCEGEALPDFEISLAATSSEVNWYDGDPGSGGSLITNSNGINSITLPASDLPGGISGVGTFTVFASYVDATTSCASETTTSNITINTLPMGALTVVSDFAGFGVSCNGSSDGEIEIIATGGTAPYSFELIQTGEMKSSPTNVTFDNLPAGDYTVRVSDNNTCGAISNLVTITEPDAIQTTINVTSNFNGAQISCNGASDGQLTVNASNGAAPYTYSIVELPSNTTGMNSGIFDNLPAGSYSVLVTDDNTCPVTTISVDINEPTVISSTPVVSQEISCAGNSDGEITATANGGTGALSYILNEIPTNTTGANSGIFSGLPQGAYSFTITDQNTCTTTTTPLTLSDPAAYSASIANDATICEGQTATLAITITGGAAPYSLNIDNLGTVALSGSTIDVTPNTTTVYTLISVTDANGCDATTLSGSASVTVDQNPTEANAGNAQEICEDNIGLSGNNPSIGTGTWELVSGSGVITNPADPNTTVTGLAIGENTFSWTIDNSVCTSSTDQVTITRLATPEGAGTISSRSGSNEFCQGATGINLSVTGITNATSYTWTLLNGSTQTTDEPSITFDIPGDAQSNTITVIGENLCGQGIVSSGFDINVVTAPDVSIDLASEILLNTETSFSFTSSESIENISWDFGDGGSSTSDNPMHTYTAPGNYNVVLTGTSISGCEVAQEVNITVNPADPISIKNAITPNGDGANDQLTIVNIEFYPSNVVTLFDRWGVEVASFEGYKNEWDLTIGGNVIPAGNYICVVELPSVNQTVKRTITVVRSSN